MADRVDENGAAYAGSQLQTQLYVNKRTAQLDEAICVQFPELVAAELEWRSPLAADGYREYWDAAFLERVDLGHRVAELKAFWPAGGPHWDALGVVPLNSATRPGVLLVEGKSYADELYSGGTGAAEGSKSRELIEQSLGWTQRQLGAENVAPEVWCGRLYQTANRLAHLCWLRSFGVRAWFVHALFTGDPHGPTTADQWASAVKAANRELGLPDTPIAGAGHVLLPAGTRDELLA